MSRIRPLLLAVVVSFAAACSNSPATTQPSPASTTTSLASINAFAGNWTSAIAQVPPASCSQHNYVITPTGENSASVTYSITCGNYSVAGSGSGSLSGQTLTWNAKGTLSGGGISCPSGFEFTNSTATLQPDNQVLVVYNAVVCGVTFTGSQMLKRK